MHEAADRLSETLVAIIYALAIISGGLGGCTVAAHQLIRGRSIRPSFFLAYTIIGGVFGLLAASYGHFVQGGQWHQIIGPALIAGASGAVVLSATNLSARFILKRLGIEVVVTVKKQGDGDA